MQNSIIKALTIIIISLFAANSATAKGGCSCGNVNNYHKATRGRVSSQHAGTRDLIRTEMNETRETLSTEAGLTRDKIEEVGAVLQKETRAQTSSLGKMFEGQGQLLEDLFKSTGLAREKLIIERQYGDKSMPPTGCEGVDLGASMRSGDRVRQRIKEETVAKAVEHSSKFYRAIDAKKANQEMLANAQEPNEMAKAMFASVVEKDDRKAVLESVFYLSDPQPPRPLSENEKQSRLGLEYEVERNIRNRHMAIVQQVLADHVARRIPSMPLEAWAVDQWNKMGGEGSPTGVVDGLMSANSVIDMLVESRVGNPNWLTVTVPSMNDTGLKREQLYMDAARLYIEREKMRMTEQLLVLSALDIADRLSQKSDTRLKQLQVNMEH